MERSQLRVARILVEQERAHGTRLLGPGGAAQPMPDGRKPEPGGWNRIQVEVEDLTGEVARLRAGARSRSDIITGVGGKQILLDDPRAVPSTSWDPGLRDGNVQRRDADSLDESYAGRIPRTAAGAIRPRRLSCRDSSRTPPKILIY